MNEFKRYEALSASAGSGKTFALTIRYLVLIFKGVMPNKILALTFTRKAAAEMENRIIETFLGLGKIDFKKNKELYEDEKNELLKILNLTQDELLEKRDNLKDTFLNSDIKISTFDSFFSTILKSFALNFGINPNYEVEEESNLRQIIDKEFVKQISTNQIFLDELSDFIVNTKSNSGDFLDSLSELLNEIGKANIDKFDSNKINTDDIKLKINLKKDEFDNIKFQIKSYCDDIINNSFPRNSTKTAIKEHNSKINQAKNLKDKFNESIYQFLKNDLVKKDSLNYRTYSKVYSDDLGDLWDRLKIKLKEFLNELEIYKITVFFKILKLYAKLKDNVNIRLNKISFNDLSTKIHELINQKDILNLIYFRLDARIEHILIDEFQDTNVMQYQILYPLIDEILSGLGQSGVGSFFYVGDIKQSIYRFRGGKKELFSKLMNDFKQINISKLDKNYRSQKSLVKFVNAIFKNPFNEILDSDGLKYIDQIAAKTNNNDEIKDLKPIEAKNFDYFKVENDDYGYIKVLSSDDVLESAAKEVKTLLDKGAKAENIAVLCWKNKHIDILKALLKDASIESNGVGNRNLFEMNNIKAVLEYAKFCITNEEIYKLNTEKLLNISVRKLNLNLQKTTTENVLYLLKNLGINADDINILAFIEYSKKYENIIEFAFNKDNANAVYNDNLGVNLLTVFRSKGLQFEHVVLCDKFQKDESNKQNFIKEYDIKSSKWFVKYRVKNREYVDKEYEKFIQKSQNLDKEEDLNKLYVAFTRAKNSFILIKSNNSNSYFGDKGLLDIKEFEFGEVIKDDDKKSSVKKEKKKINLAKIKPQKITPTKKEITPNIHSIKFGLAFHYALEMSDFSVKNLDTALAKSKNKFVKYLKEDDFYDIKNRLKNLFLNKEFINIIKDAEILKEQPFKIDTKIKQVDLLAIRKDEIYIIDYKSAYGFEEENKAQILSYKELISKIYKDKKVKAFIFYILKDEISVLKV